eukprot:c9566_g1_i1 orf=3-434(-)
MVQEVESQCESMAHEAHHVHAIREEAYSSSARAETSSNQCLTTVEVMSEEVAAIATAPLTSLGWVRRCAMATAYAALASSHTALGWDNQTSCMVAFATRAVNCLAIHMASGTTCIKAPLASERSLCCAATARITSSLPALPKAV